MPSIYMHGYETLREQSGFTPAEQEVVFLTISRENGCGYCIVVRLTGTATETAPLCGRPASTGMFSS